MIRISQLKMPLGHTRNDLLLKAAKELHIQPEMIKEIELVKQSVDARKKPEIHYSYIVDIMQKRKKTGISQFMKKSHMFFLIAEMNL